MSLKVASLASGSSGNAYYVEGREGAVLIDAGLTGKTILAKLEEVGGNQDKIVGIIITHEHSDHMSGAGVLQRKMGWKLWMTPGTRNYAPERLGNFTSALVHPQKGMTVAGMDFEFIPTPHDAQEPVAVIVEADKQRCGFFTDLGHPFPGLDDHLRSLDLVFLESNYDPNLLSENQEYPAALKKRIQGKHGHLSNCEAATLVKSLGPGRLRTVMLSHLSDKNNSPDIALAEFIAILGKHLSTHCLRVDVARRDRPSKLFHLS
ncbi:MAG: MBL fold metallo-hydrolase [Planctomycetota bacterium]|jgi:phosphoribosyl 1,2-cyclic phosphodiesterase|nr:MBL fold metallo-hydrolase [Planctomycetota bacterium]